MDDTRLYLVFEFLPMDLKKLITSGRKKHLDKTTTRSLTCQVNFETCLT
jgi:cyclin-dependent kinase 1